MPNLIPIEKEKEDGMDTGEVDSPRYPYGTELDFRDEMVDKLSIRGADIGHEVVIIAKGFVSSINERKSERVGDDVDESITVGIQLTEVQISPAKTGSSVDDVLKTLYPDGA